MGGTAQSFYEKGIEASFKANGVSGAAEYLTGTTTQIPYVDPKNTANNAPAMTKITVKWNEADNFETKLERIITQKWIALYPGRNRGVVGVQKDGLPEIVPGGGDQKS
jgi:hypothetical protein